MKDADRNAGAGLLGVRPAWVGMTFLRDLLGAKVVASDGQLLLHAGPAFNSWQTVPAPVRHSMAFAAIYEGWAPDIDAAMSLLGAGKVEFGPAQDHDIVVPLAGVVSPSMALHVVQDLADGEAGAKFHAVVNEGNVHALRLGSLDPDLPDHHSWLNGAFTDWIAGLFETPIDLAPLLQRSLELGDDGHSNSTAGSRLLADELRARASTTPQRVTEFLQDSTAFALNLWMAAAALSLQAGAGVTGSTLITRAGGNGVDFGIQVSGLPDRWFTVPATPPIGDVPDVFSGLRATGAIGDSAVVDVVGLGGAALKWAPSSVERLGSHLPDRALERPELLLAEPHGPLGTRTALTAEAVVREGLAPIVLLGMIESTGLEGRIGGGAYVPPVTLFQAALSAIEIVPVAVRV
ncbi:DUF1116 domain-containing protein [Paenarthrobacter sp. PH39-S1]|uniref:oxamate carbamoyltransferase subunit AllG family protein n=1 Tax=Paenarthrobacter sp. PH39-S1 TaxID=3046204 RepID=UPI0024B8C7BD|nr:DUF1116 domain-containing protein [Paenarthrobacter sp. PH39-S1]MDJ0358438.1 DUF1116 domain-containing protein [Paenarthrobacter sp. PH39-S1]